MTSQQGKAMAASKDDETETGEPEPVDAEFEAVEDEDGAAEGAPKPARKGPGWVLFVFTLLLTAVIAAAVAWALTRYLAPQLEGEPDTSALEARIAELEARDPAAGLSQRLSQLETLLTDRIEALDGDLSALEGRVAELEARPAASGVSVQLPDNLAERLNQLEAQAGNALDTARQVREALSQLSREDAGAAASQALEALRGEIESLRSRLAQAETDLAAEDEALAARLQSVRQNLGQTQGELAQIADQAGQALQLARSAEAGAGPQTQALRELSARALGLAALTEAASGSAPFEAERAALARVWPNQPDLQALQSIARSGAPTQGELEDRFPGDAIRQAAGGTRPFWGLVEVRPAGESEGEGPAAIAARAETRLARGDLAGAVEAAAQLEDAPAEAAADWLREARARLEIERRIETLREALRAQAAEGDVE